MAGYVASQIDAIEEMEEPAEVPEDDDKSRL
jgi:hypothetical protein